MACMTHDCLNWNCGNIIFNNSGGPSICPKCGDVMIHTFDESPDDYDELLNRRLSAYGDSDNCDSDNDDINDDEN